MTVAEPSIAISGRLVRVLAPKWASTPLSGGGAAVRGGRFNDKGQEALYMSYTLAVAATEYGQDLGPRPGTFCYYDVDLNPVADLTSEEALKALGIVQVDLFTSWKDYLSRQLRPPTWDVAATLKHRGFMAARYESVLPENRPPRRANPGLNVVVWRWSLATAGEKVVALDPSDDLPHDRASWAR